MNDNETLDVDIVFNIEFTKEQLKELEIRRSEDVNGIYVYNYGNIFINVNSEDFKNLNETSIIDLFTKVATHETLHHSIYKITNTYTNEQEDNFVLKMAGQEEWTK